MQQMFYVTDSGGLSHHGILGMHWGIRRFQPYAKGQVVKGGKEVGKATRVKQQLTPVEKAKKQAQMSKEKTEASRIKTQTKNAKATAKAQKKAADARAKAEINIQKAKAKQAKQRQKMEIKSIRDQMKAERNKPKQQEAAKNAEMDRVKFEEAKKKAIQSGSASDVAKFKGKMTNNELQSAVTRLNLEQKLSEHASKEQKSAMDKIDNMFKTAKKVGDWAETGLNTYKSIEKILNKTTGRNSGGNQNQNRNRNNNRNRDNDDND